MIHQEAPCRSLRGWTKDRHKGFYIDGKDLEDCLHQLREWGKNHPEKWIYYFDCGTKPGYPIPVARRIIEVYIRDSYPGFGLMILWRLFQKGERYD